MITKKSVAAAAIAVGLTATAGASYASNDGSDAEQSATTMSQRAAVKVDRAKAAADNSSDDAARKKCLSKKKIRSINLFMPYKKVMKKMPRPTHKSQSGGLRFRYWNACTSSLDTDFDVTFKKRKGNWKVYGTSVFWS